MKTKPAAKNSVRGQALIETLFTTVFLTVVVFAAIQFVIIVINELVMNEAAFSVSRVAVVSGKNELQSKVNRAAAYLVYKNIDLANITYASCDVPREGLDLQGVHPGSKVGVYSAVVKYHQSVIFGSYLGGSRIIAAGSGGSLKKTSVAKMVKSPNEEFYCKAYKDGPNFK